VTLVVNLHPVRASSEPRPAPVSMSGRGTRPPVSTRTRRDIASN